MPRIQWIHRFDTLISAQPLKPGIWRRKEGGFVIRARVRDPRTGKDREIRRILPDGTLDQAVGIQAAASRRLQQRVEHSGDLRAAKRLAAVEVFSPYDKSPFIVPLSEYAPPRCTTHGTRPSAPSSRSRIASIGAARRSPSAKWPMARARSSLCGCWTPRRAHP